MPERAVELEEFGIRHNPDEWHLYYNEGFIRYMELKDYAGAAEAFARPTAWSRTRDSYASPAVSQRTRFSSQKGKASGKRNLGAPTSV